MKAYSHKRARWAIVPALALLGLLFPVSQRIENDPHYPKEYNQFMLGPERGNTLSTIREGGTVGIMAMMGGFRPLVVNLLWLKADQYWHMGASGWYKLNPILQTICEMDPHFIDAWSTFGWHLAWNVCADAADQDKPKWIQAGIEAYKRGQYFNPDHYDLFKDLAWLYHDKLKDYQAAIPEWKETLKRPDAPIYVRHMLAHAYENTWQVERAVATWKECLRVDRRDQVARSAVDWWAEQTSDKQKLNAELTRILERENRIRKTRRLPLAEQPFSIK